MPGNGKVAFSATDPSGRKVIAYQSTLDSHRMKHQEPFTDEDIVSCIESPTMIAKSGHVEKGHESRYVYYKDGAFEDGGPTTMKTVVEHSKQPGVLTSAFRTSKRSADGAIVYIDNNMKKGIGKWSQ